MLLMKINISADILGEALKAILPIPKKKIEYSFRFGTVGPEHILFSASENILILTGTDSDISTKIVLNADITGEGSFGVDGEILLKILIDQPKQDISLSIDNLTNTLGLKCQSAEFTLSVLRSYMFSEIEFQSLSQSSEVLAEELKNIVSNTSLPMSEVDDDDDNYAGADYDETCGIFLQNVYSKLRFIATNRYSMAIYEINFKNKSRLEPLVQGVIVPSEGVSAIKRMIDLGASAIKMSFNGSYLLLNSSERHFLSIPLITGRFPKYQSVMPDKAAFKFTVNRTLLLDAAKKLYTVAEEKKEYSNTIGERTLHVKISKKELTLIAGHPLLGHARAILDIDYTGRKMLFSVNIKHLMDILSVIEKDEVTFELNNEISPIIVKFNLESRFMGVIMPMVMPQKIKKLFSVEQHCINCMSIKPIKTRGGGIKSFVAAAIELPFVPHSAAVGKDGKLLPWRSNTGGPIVDGTSGSEWRVASGSLKLKNDGTVWASGGNDEGQLGDGTTTGKRFNREIPGLVIGLTDVITIATGRNYGIALKQDGSVWAWGYNGHGELGLGNSTPGHWLPERVKNLSDIIAVYAGMALKNDGTVWTWGGENYYGILGNGKKTGHYSPSQIFGLTNVVAICESSNHRIALKSDGTVWSWGRNNSGQLGDGSLINRSLPVQAVGLTGIVAISTEKWGENSWALKDDGTVWIWGANNSSNHYPIGNVNLYGQASCTPVQIGVACCVVDLPEIGERKVIFKNNRSVVLEYVDEAPDSDPYWLRAIEGQEKDGSLLARTVIMQGSIVPEQPCLQRLYLSNEQEVYSYS